MLHSLSTSLEKSRAESLEKNTERVVWDILYMKDSETKV